MNGLTLWLTGSLSPAQRVWSAAAPALLLVFIALTGAIVFAIRNALVGDYRDKEIESRGSTIVLGMWIRRYFSWLMTPILNLFLWLRIPPSAITLLSLQLAVGSAFALASGRMALGGWLFLLAGACDFFDGRVARLTGQVHPAGAVLDSVVDRYVEGIMYIGLAWFYRSSWVLAVVLIAWFGSMLIPYVRARGEALGVQMKDSGFIQRPERMVVLGLSVALSPIVEAIFVPTEVRPPHRLAIAGIAFLAIASQLSTLQRLIHATRSLSNHPHEPLSNAERGRNIVSAGAATLVDVALVAWLVYFRGFQLPIATLVGCALGSVVRFMIHRLMTMHHEGTAALRASRFAVVSAGSTAMNVGLVTLLVLLPDAIPAAAAWLAVRGLVSITWNYPLFQGYVFGRTANSI